MRLLHWYCCLLAAATLFLIAAGGMVTSTGSGLAVPDWPTTYGQSMVTFPIDDMVGGIFYEHGHRLIASAVGVLTVGAVIWIWRVESRTWVRRLVLIALAAVILQGVLGGLTVLYLLPDAISVSHAGLAQIFFCMTVTLALVTSKTWRIPPRMPADDRRLRRHLTLLTAVIYLQILLGATMRHTGAGLAIPDFPLAYGRLVPPFWNFDIAIHFAHRLGALLIAGLAIAQTASIWRRYPDRTELRRPAAMLLAVITAQITLGAYVVLSGKNVTINTLHVVTGATVLATSLVLTLRAFRVRFAEGLVTA